ncbi:DUF6175 family protein [Flavobacterium sp. SUN046]|uniref:DUF6175 family protein n=1 Tax=Flavobacterium sp. SUN046 TaxID=3002440 RepID=UPI002DBC54A9|nr:DUF6175 family protein [Flavobacterium sp. SUN046]MEC4051127.1 DUF6175 family protein [Flavobacterium sp. SUN046]
MKKCTNLLMIIGFWAISFNTYSQAKKPTLMILPSDNWCEQRYFMTEFDNQGTKQKVPNYKQAFQEDTEIGQVISKIGSLMLDRGFPLKDAEQELKAIEQKAAEDNMTTSTTSGSGLSESPLDKLKNRAKADIVIQIWWKVSKTEQGKVISFVIEAFDAYTSKRIAASTGNGTPNNKDIVPVLLQNAILANIDTFAAQLQSYFDDIFANGREVRLTIKKWNNWDKDLETEIDGEEIIDHITKWMDANTVQGRFNKSDASESVIRFEQVRIPLYDDKNKALDARDFGKKLQKFLKAAPYNFEVKLMTRGLGEAILVLGEK